MTPSDLATALAPVATGAQTAVSTGITIGTPVYVILVAVGIVFLVMRKFGIKK
ncbi:hypothetical protein GALL_248680 [mine drainage metagenome]|uniref:Uncharacterized protein n=1 Tax=mine drainage metagenome TaxID=410659 RepID=A0A1J5RCU9_9ZZZZ